MSHTAGDRSRPSRPGPAPAAKPSRLPWLLLLVVAALGLGAAALLMVSGLREGRLLPLLGGLAGAGVAGGCAVALVLRLLGRKTSVWVPRAGGLLLAAALVLGLAIATREKVGAACSGAGLADAAEYSRGPGPHPIEAMHDGRRIWLPPDKSWRPASIAETELVACVGPVEQYVIEVCQYSGGNNLTRYGFRRRVILLAARTGEVLASETFAGEWPRACRPTEQWWVWWLWGGTRIDAGAVWEWLSPWVTSTPSQETVLGTGVMWSTAYARSGPSRQGTQELGCLGTGTVVEILETANRWVKIRGVSPEGEMVTGWIQDEEWVLRRR